mgnify:CR=1 FL=1
MHFQTSVDRRPSKIKKKPCRKRRFKKLIKNKYPVSTKDKVSNIVLIKVSGKQLYESRFENFSKKEAYTACKRLKKYNRDCFVRL